MRALAQVALLSCLALGYGQVAPPAPAPSRIVCWQAGRKLTWDDFQATRRPAEPKEDSVPGTFLGATTEATAVVYDVLDTQGRPGIVVRVEFDKTASWVNKRRDFDLGLTLTHEQVHFDIVELTGRKIRYVLARYAALHKPLVGPAIQADIACLYAEEDDLQSRYDKETWASYTPTTQARWKAQVDGWLKQLSRYQSTVSDCEIADK